ncbi:PPIC-type PPIASE domain-containing protein [Ruminococcus sp. YE71]|uniref:peptidylprolyl isomerase n=1 Tax=unclassified Ruminococcus TaxID=2608920 RepID=UPI0008819822|nr:MULTISPECIES: peptidylprolyl isomerase [unclassified Ruminococcus]SDA23732.1 PPIC-type PPIASE domain-containing protein [Ruminococcus sp. YE78]SFW40390.1 PPIC-type PPIASE domain-containing protein [Ruminococcus sp. YE71]
MIKKFTALFAALVITASAFCGCSKSDSKDSSSTSSGSGATTSSESKAESAAESTADAQNVPTASLTIDGEKVDTTDLVMLTVDGRDVSFDEFRYYYFTAVQQLSQTYGTSLESLAATEDGFKTLMERVINNIKQDYVTYKVCADNGITLTDEDNAANEESYNSYKSNAGSDEKFAEALASAYMTDEVFRNRIALASLYVKAEDQLFTNEGKFATGKEEFRTIVQDPEQYACVRSILIPYCCKAEITDESVSSAFDTYDLNGKYQAKSSAYEALSEDEKNKVKEQTKKLADDVLAKIQKGEDFEKMLSEYGWDPGMESNTQGYYMNHNTSFVQEFLDASFALKEGEVSSLVENSSYGWFIIKRMPIDMDYVEENIDSMIIEYDTPNIEKLYIDTMEKMDVKYSDYYNKLDINSIT